jgi:hypothetical protein
MGVVKCRHALLSSGSQCVDSTVDCAAIQKYNKPNGGMADDLKERLEAKWDRLPSCMNYAELINFAVQKLHITKAEVRNRYGKYTYAQWSVLLEDEV